MESIERSINVAAPIAQAFEPWSNVEAWPMFLKAIREVRRIDEKQFQMSVERGGQHYESVAEITLVIPNDGLRGVVFREQRVLVSFPSRRSLTTSQRQDHSQ